MRRSTLHHQGFTLLELLMSMALFTVAAVSLAEALNMISLTVSESIDDTEVREQLRATMLEVSRDAALTAETRETNPDKRGLYFRIEVERLDLKNEEGQTLENLFEVKVTAMRDLPSGRNEELDTASTVASPNLL
ncbi:MAG: prepilin-type N-terminal cleavage/methylation domain-containing protein [Verrucomicrobiales bacterium]|jgi:prepilin-type N-terminal cleavage/methylation domain-containing protein|nr:prepilin-type N-terminal cleavage/methylation domain-containing protein [Verrucomicrobiales bacterium]